MLNAHPPTLDSNGEVVSTNPETVVRIGAELQGIMDRALGRRSTRPTGARQDAEVQRASGQARGTAADDRRASSPAAPSPSFPKPRAGSAPRSSRWLTDAVHDEVDGQIEQNIGDYSDSQHRNLDDVRQGKASEVY